MFIKAKRFVKGYGEPHYTDCYVNSDIIDDFTLNKDKGLYEGYNKDESDIHYLISEEELAKLTK